MSRAELNEFNELKMLKCNIRITGQKMCDVICKCEESVKPFSTLKVIGQIALAVNKSVHPP